MNKYLKKKLKLLVSPIIYVRKKLLVPIYKYTVRRFLRKTSQILVHRSGRLMPVFDGNVLLDYLEFHKGLDFGTYRSIKEIRGYDNIEAFGVEGKRVALCLSGFMRTYKSTLRAMYKNIVKPYDADVFIYTPSVEGVSGNVGSKRVEMGGGVDEGFIRDIFGDNLKEMVLWDYDDSEFEGRVEKAGLKQNREGWHPTRLFSFYYQIKKVLELKAGYEAEHGFRYDAVIRTRGDLGCLSRLNLGCLDLGRAAMYYPKYSGFIEKSRMVGLGGGYIQPFVNYERGECFRPNEVALTDFVTMGGSKVMDGLGELYDNIEEYYERGVHYTPENMMAYHMFFEKDVDLVMKDMLLCNLFREGTESIVRG